MIIKVVGYILLRIVFNQNINRSLLENQTLEIEWTILPAIILLFIAFPSLRLLYLLDEVNTSRSTIKVIGRKIDWQ